MFLQLLLGGVTFASCSCWWVLLLCLVFKVRGILLLIVILSFSRRHQLDCKLLIKWSWDREVQCKSETENFHLNVKASLFEMCWLQLQGCVFHLPKFHYISQSKVVIPIFHANYWQPLQFVCDQGNYNRIFSAAHSLQVISPSVSIFLHPEESPSAGHYKESQVWGTSAPALLFKPRSCSHLSFTDYDLWLWSGRRAHPQWMPHTCHYYWTAHVWTLLRLIMHYAQNQMEYTFIWKETVKHWKRLI